MPKAYQLFNPEVKSTFGGAEVQLSLLAKELAKRSDLDIHFMVADYGQKERETYESVEVWRSLNFKQSIFKQFFTFFRVFKKINADIYIQRTLTPQSGLIASYCKLKRKRFVYMVAHDSETDGTHRVYRNFVASFLAKLTFKLADKVIVQNQFQEKNLLEKKIKSYILNSSYPVDENIQKRKQFVLWVGRSEEWKRPELFLELAKLMPQEQFVMICPPATNNLKFSKEIEKKAKKIKNLKFIEFVPFRQIDDYFAKAKVFVNTSTQEGFPNTFIQAMKNKTPILSLNVNPNEFITDYYCGFCCDDNFDLLKENLRILLSDSALYNGMSENAFKYAKVNHDIKVNAQQFLEIITT